MIISPRREFLDSVIECVKHVEDSRSVHGHPVRGHELPGTVAGFLYQPPQVLPLQGELLHPPVDRGHPKRVTIGADADRAFQLAAQPAAGEPARLLGILTPGGKWYSRGRESLHPA